MKKIIKIFAIGIIFLLVFAFNIKGNSVFAAKKESCKILIEQKKGKKILLYFYNDDGSIFPRYGNFYYFKTTDNDVAFCLDPEKRLASTFKSEDERANFHSTNASILYGKIYQWYLDNPSYRDLAQVAMWYVNYGQGSLLGLQNTLITFQLENEQVCLMAENDLKSAFNNDKFSCTCFINKISGIGKQCDIKEYSSKNGLIYTPVDISLYKDTILNSSSLSGAGERYTELASSLANAAFRQYSQYSGDLYIWHPNASEASYQRFIAPKACKIHGYVCADKYSNYLAGEYGSDLTSPTTINNFKQSIIDPENVKIQDDGSAKCGDNPPDGPSYLCSDFETNGSYKDYSCNQLRNGNVMDDPENIDVCVDGSNGKAEQFACGSDSKKCEPEISTTNMCCSLKDPTLAVLKIKDADSESFDIVGNKDCINNNTAYTIDGDRIASVDYSLSVPDYCTVFCWEEFEVTLPYEPSLTNVQTPNPTNTINSGRVFWWGMDYNNNIFGKVTVHRVCKTNPDYGKFEERWNENEKAIIQAYAEYLAQKAYYDKIVNGNYTVKEKPGCILEPAEEGTWQSANYASECAGQWGCRCVDNNGNEAGSPSCANNCCGHWEKQKGGKPAVTGSEYYIEQIKDVKYTGTVATGSGLQNLRIPSSLTASADSQEVKTECSKTQPANYDWAGAAKSELDSRRDKVLSLVKNRATLYAAIKQCQDSNIDVNKLYDNQFKIEMKDVSLDTFGVKDKTMEVRAVDVGYTTNRKETQDGSANLYCNLSGNGLLAEMDKSVYDVCASNDLMDHYDQYGNYYTTIATYAPFVWDFSGSYDIKYKESMHFYVYSDNDKLSTEPTRSTDIDENNMQAVLTEAGWYGIKFDAKYGVPLKFNVYGNQEMSVSVKMSNFGNKGHFDALINGSQYASKFMEGCYNSSSNSNAISPVGDHYEGIYTCPYQVANLIYSPPGGGGPCQNNNCFSIVYRIIDMGAGNTARVFPGKDGNDGTKSRKIGSNWASFIENNPNKFKKITTATNDTKTGIYNQKPIYSIELSPTLIGQIRKDNNSYRDAGKDPYTSYTNTSNKPKIACKYGNTVYNVEEKSCVSSYITKLIKQGKITGRFADSNESKRIKLIHDYKTA